MQQNGQGKRRRQATRPNSSRTAIRDDPETRNQKKHQTRSKRQRQITYEHEALVTSEGRAPPIISDPVLQNPRKYQEATQTVQGQDISIFQERKDISTKDFAAEPSNNNGPELSSGHGEFPKPWETLVIGANLGENLSKIEYLNRQILQQEFIIKWTEQTEPGSIEHQQEVLRGMRQRREVVKLDEENSLPRDERQLQLAIAERLEILNSAFKQSEFKTQKMNIETAIEGYKTGVIGCSKSYTLLYAGTVVDTCPSYHSFAVDRNERLDRYFGKHGEGWLWYEPPLTGPNSKVYAKKGFCSDQEPFSLDTTDGIHGKEFGVFSINMRIIVDRNKVYRGGEPPSLSLKNTAAAAKFTQVQKFPCKSATFAFMLDCGASFPTLVANDFERLGIKDFRKNYAPQTVLRLRMAEGEIQRPLYDLEVGLGAALTEKPRWHRLKEPSGWPHEQGIMGGLCPVVLFKKRPEPVNWDDRLSGMFPFKVCYLSSVPTAGKIWLGENRRDVLGAKRFPPYKRHVTDKERPGEKPEALAAHDKTVDGLSTPDEVIFLHRISASDDPTQQQDFSDVDIGSRNSTKYGIVFKSEEEKYRICDEVEFGPVMMES